MQLGNQYFSSQLIQGPLAGISNTAFRQLVWQHSQPAFVCSEMISCKTLIHSTFFALERFINKAAIEGPLCVQLSGNDPSEVATAVKIVTDAGADLIDLNCGCPVKKIRHKGAGSSLLTNPALLFQLINAMKLHTSVPVSVKIRVDGHSGEKFNQEVAKVIQEAGADFVIVHGRHWTEHYETPCRYDEIAFFVNAMKIPVIGNGDVRDVSSLKKLLATGCSGAMISRAGVGQPWLINQLMTELKEEKFELPSLTEIYAMLMQHVMQLAKLLNNEKMAILQARKFAKYYARQIKNRGAFIEEINRCEELTAFDEISKYYLLNAECAIKIL